jgi:hypothetical protein
LDVFGSEFKQRKTYMTTKKTLFFSLGLLAVISMQSISAGNQQEDAYRNFVKQRLLVEPGEQRSALGETLKWIVTPLPALFMIVLNGKDIYKVITKPCPEDETEAFGWYRGVTFGVIGILISAAIYYPVNHFVAKPFNFDANCKRVFLDFLHKWPTYKKMTPQILHQIFDDLYTKVTQQTLSEEDVETLVPEILKDIKALLKNA